MSGYVHVYVCARVCVMVCVCVFICVCACRNYMLLCVYLNYDHYKTTRYLIKTTTHYLSSKTHQLVQGLDDCERAGPHEVL